MTGGSVSQRQRAAAFANECTALAERMHPDEVDTSVDLVRLLLREQRPQWAALAIEPVLPRGTDNALYRVGDRMVARLPRREHNVKTLKREQRWLPRLAPMLDVAVPVPVAEGKPGAGYPFEWAIYSWLDGETPKVESIATDAFTDDLVRFISTLRRIDPRGGPAPGPDNAFRGQPLERRDRLTRAAIAALSDRIDVDLVTTVWEEALRASAWRDHPVWIHGDLDVRNVVVKQGRIAAVIDWGCVAVGDPAYDAMAAWKLVPRERRESFRGAIGIDDATLTRARGLLISQAVMALSYYTLDNNAILVNEAERWLTDALAA